MPLIFLTIALALMGGLGHWMMRAKRSWTTGYRLCFLAALTLPFSLYYAITQYGWPEDPHARLWLGIGIAAVIWSLAALYDVSFCLQPQKAKDGT